MIDRSPASGRERELLELARRDRAAAGRALGALAPEEQLALVCDAPVSRRRLLLDLLPEPERVIPLLPEAELVFTLKAIGLDESAWILDLATPEQVTACLDLDAWRGTVLETAALEHWMAALAEVGDEALLRHLRAIDPELCVLWVKDRADVVMRPSDSEDAGWEPPPGSLTLDGQFHFVARRDGDDLAPLLRVLHVLFQGDYWVYFRLLQGAIWELGPEAEEWALRWRSGRLEDLGFPPWDEAMDVYRFVPERERARLPDEALLLQGDEWKLPVWMPSLPAGRDARDLLFRAIGELAEEERRAAFYRFIALANKVAVADRMDLADAASTPAAIAKAARWVSRGLEHVVDARGARPEDVLRRLDMEWLFRVGASLDPEMAKGPPGSAGGPQASRESRGTD